MMSTLMLFSSSNAAFAQSNISDLELVMRQELTKLFMGYNPHKHYKKLESRVFNAVSCTRDDGWRDSINHCADTFLKKYSSCYRESFKAIANKIESTLLSRLEDVDFIAQSVTNYSPKIPSFFKRDIFAHSKSNIDVYLPDRRTFYYVDPHVRCYGSSEYKCIYINGLIQRCL